MIHFLIFLFDISITNIYQCIVNVLLNLFIYFSLSRNNTDHYHTLDTANFSFHNSSKLSSETRHAYIANFRLYSHSAVLIHGLCQITVGYPIRLDIY